jgi:hypothetical protein
VWATSHSRGALVITPWLRPPDLPKGHAYTLEPGRPTPGSPNLLRPPIASSFGIGILTDFPSATHFCLTLGADSPCADERCAGNLGLTASRLFTCFIATHVSIRTSDASSAGPPTPSQAYGTLSYRDRRQKSEDRSQKRRVSGVPNFDRVLAASWRSLGIHRATLSTSAHRCNRDLRNSAPKPASRLRTRWLFARNA